MKRLALPGGRVGGIFPPYTCAARDLRVQLMQVSKPTVNKSILLPEVLCSLVVSIRDANERRHYSTTEVSRIRLSHIDCPQHRGGFIYSFLEFSRRV